MDERLLRPEARGVTPLKDFALALTKKFADYDVVIYETWRLYPEMGKKLTGNEMLTPQLIGMIRLLGWLHPKVKLVSQGAQIKKIAQQAMPKEWHKWLEDSTEQHDQDAAYHLYYYYFKEFV